MQAGRELDALVAEKIFNWVDFWYGADKYRSYVMGYPPCEQAAGINGERAPVPPYSTDIGAAWQAIEQMEQRGYWCEMRTPFMEPFCKDGYWAGFTPHGTSGWNGTPDHWTSTDSLPLSICLAALACLEAEAARKTVVEEEGTP